MPDTTQDSWNILVVDDEDDVHLVTALALKRQVWRGRNFSITRADSSRQAKQILEENPPSTFHVALVDVVMETETAGLDLCDYIRSKLPLSIRIVLRTGQAGVAPEEKVVEEYEIDHYLAKVDATADRILAVIIASLRSSMDVRMLLALRDQLKSLAGAMQGTLPPASLDKMLTRGLLVMDWKYRANTSFYPSLDAAPAEGEPEAAAKHRASLLDARKAGLPPRVLHKAAKFGLQAPGAQIWFDSIGEDSAANDSGLWSKMKRMLGGALPEGPKPFGLVIEPGRSLGPKTLEGLEKDLSPLTDNWAIAQRLVSLQQGVAGVRAGQAPAKTQDP